MEMDAQIAASLNLHHYGIIPGRDIIMPKVAGIKYTVLVPIGKISSNTFCQSKVYYLKLENQDNLLKEK